MTPPHSFPSLGTRDPERLPPAWWGALAGCLSAVLLTGPMAARPASAARTETVLVDRVLAVVDDDPILVSDLEQVIGLELARQRDGESEEAFRRRVLDDLVAERLRFHEMDRFGLGQVPVEEVERHFEEVRSRFAGKAEFQARLARLGLDENGLRQVVARQLMVLAYVEERLGPRIFVSLDDIRAYYDGELAPALRRRGEPPPPIEEVREEIRAVLKERRLNEEIAKWTEELRAEADVEIYPQPHEGELPPLVPPSRE